MEKSEELSVYCKALSKSVSKAGKIDHGLLFSFMSWVMKNYASGHGFNSLSLDEQLDLCGRALDADANLSGKEAGYFSDCLRITKATLTKHKQTKKAKSKSLKSIEEIEDQENNIVPFNRDGIGRVVEKQNIKRDPQGVLKK